MNEEALLIRIQDLPNQIKGTFVIGEDFNESLNVLKNICHENIIRHL